MRNIEFKLDSSESEFDDIFFNRPVSRVHASWVGIVTSKNVSIKKISTIYQIVDILSHNVSLAADDKQGQGVLPTDVVLKSKKTPGYSNVDEGIYNLQNCKIIVFLAGKELNSNMELFMEQLLDNYTGTLITDHPKILNNIEYKGECVLVADNSKLNAKYDQGLNHLTQLALVYANDYLKPVLFFNNNQLICVDPNMPTMACVINTKERIQQEDYLGFLAGLLADKKIPLDQDWLRYCQAAGFLMRKMNSKGLNGVKKYLDDKF